MSSEAVRKTIPVSEVDRIRAGREILRSAAIALDETSERLEAGFSDAVALLAGCTGQVIVCGVGKAVFCIRSRLCTGTSVALPKMTWRCCCPTAENRPR